MNFKKKFSFFTAVDRSLAGAHQPVSAGLGPATTTRNPVQTLNGSADRTASHQI